jgi:hypothetical protein
LSLDLEFWLIDSLFLLVNMMSALLVLALVELRRLANMLGVAGRDELDGTEKPPAGVEGYGTVVKACVWSAKRHGGREEESERPTTFGLGDDY